MLIRFSFHSAYDVHEYLICINYKTLSCFDADHTVLILLWRRQKTNSLHCTIVLFVMSGFQLAVLISLLFHCNYYA